MAWNPITWFRMEAPIVEADVLNFIQKVETSAQVAIADAQKALTWIAQETPAIAADLQMVEGFVLANPALAINPTVLAAVTAANLAVQGLNAFAATYNSNASLADQAKAVVAGYQAVKQAQIASAQSAHAAVSNTATASK